MLVVADIDRARAEADAGGALRRRRQRRSSVRSRPGGCLPTSITLVGEHARRGHSSTATTITSALSSPPCWEWR
ncbi:hypothetical protein [Actinomadura keratinilytica]|jgi:hypothetical protein|uniref:hypothetical protein n=1 Tax=Actinomadura keratinilytica TaxID=547461 RepID=UPI0031EE0A1E